MQQKAVVVGLLVIMLTSFASAQSTPKVEVLAGYSLLHNGANSIENFNGWNASATTYLNRWLGMTADFAGFYSSATFTSQNAALNPPTFTVRENEHLHTFLFGPHFACHKPRYTLFTHALLGLTRDSDISRFPPPSAGSIANFNELTVNTNSFTTALGGGVDIRVSDRIAVRPVQADYLYRRWSPLGQDINNNLFRYSGGVIFRFGGK